MINQKTPNDEPSPYFYPHLEATRLQLLAQKLNAFASELHAYPAAFDEATKLIASHRADIQKSAHYLDNLLETTRREYLNSQGYDL